MDWMAETEERRASPLALWPEARSAIVLARIMGQDLDPLERLEDRASGVISVYALNRDYHDVVKGKLKRIAQWLAQHTKAEVKVFVDTAPLMEKPLAQKAGLGWQGKHTNLVSRELGSWFFIGTILTDGRIARGCSGDGSLRLMPRLPRHLPDQGLSRALPARCAALHFLSHHRAQGPHRARIPRRPWATASMAAMIASPSARGTSSPRRRTRRSSSARDDLRAPPLADAAGAR